MTPGLIAMAILGCADTGDQCQTVQYAPVRFASVAQCNAAAEATLGGFATLAYPVLAARCQKIDVPTVAEASATPVG